jgi:hypothetical protein
MIEGKCENATGQLKLTPASTVLEKLTLAQLLRKFHAFYAARRLFTAFIKTRH